MELTQTLNAENIRKSNQTGGTFMTEKKKNEMETNEVRKMRLTICSFRLFIALASHSTFS